MKIRKPFERKRVSFATVGHSAAKQSFKDECDINQILRKYAKTGIITHMKEFGARYGDFVSAPEYQEACNQVIAARDMFETLPSKVRKRFSNDPAQFLAFVHDPENTEELISMGLARAPEPAPEPAPAAEDPPGPSDA